MAETSPDTGAIAETDIAIVGMAGHFPGADDVDELWERVARGDDCLTDLDPDELIRDGADPGMVRSPDYVLRNGRIDHVADFDHDFFGISARDASIMDPQHRHFLECAWEALESAAHTPEGFEGSIGVFGGSGMNTYLLHNLLSNPQLVEQLGWFLLRHTSNDKDFLTTTLSYRLGLNGPSVNVQTACSTSLVAVHLAAQSLLSYECDLALAGGVTIEFPHAHGYEYREGEILSPSGRCRAFDAQSEGTVLTGGAAVVALRRLTDASDDGDPILAVIKGSAVNNDGSRKVGYLAPSVDGHADVVKEALALTGIDARTIGLLEAHGTGTAVGDPIEVAALTEAFRTSTADTGFCRLGSTKPNIGHLDTAAGTASLVKVVQALRHRTLPPVANHTAPSPLLEIERTPFEVSGTASPWESDTPRRAGVSSLGVGGTNAHAIIEEAPAPPPTPPAANGQVFALSGQTRQAVDDAAERLASFIEAHPDVNLADVAHTLVAGRRAMTTRRVVTVTDAAGAPDELRSRDRRRRPTVEAPDAPPRVGFTFPGGGAQYVGMGAGLDDRFDVFHEVRREGAEIVRGLDGVDLDPLFGPDADEAQLRLPTASLPAVFVTSVALARQWMAWGVEPDVMIGHSLGEYAAAHLAGVLSFEDALSLVVTRSALMERASGDDAAMLVIPLPEADVVGRLTDDLSLATVNADDECVVAGPSARIDELVAALVADDVEATRIPLVAAAHSSMLDPVLDEFLTAVRGVRLEPPTRRYVSNLTGDWITAEQATDPQYWVDHLRHTVRFAQGLTTVLDESPTVLVELGPGQSLSSYARRSGTAAGTIASLRHPDDDIADTNHTLGAFGQLWMYGVDVDLGQFDDRSRRRLRLPTYPFQREPCWIEPGNVPAVPTATSDASTFSRIEELDDMFWRPSWREAPERTAGAPVASWLVVGEHRATDIADELVRRGRSARVVAQLADLDDPIDDDAESPDLEGVDGVVVVGATESFTRAASRWLDDAPRGARLVGRAAAQGRFVAVTAGALHVDQAARRPADAMALGTVLVAAREYPDVETALVDADPETTIAELVDEIEGATGVVALRDCRRRTPTLEHAPAAVSDGPTFRHGGTYLVTGGLGGIGFEIAKHLATTHAANLVVMASESVPEGIEREAFLRANAFDHPTSRRIRRVAELEQLGVKVLVVAADVGDAVQVRAALDEAERRVGTLDGAIHAAGRLRDRLLETASFDDHRHVVDAKAGGALGLAAELERRQASLLVLLSSTSTTLAPEGQTAYVAANAVLDAMAGRRGPLRIATLGFGVWARIGMASEAARRQHLELPDGEPADHPVLGEVAVDHQGRVTAFGRLDTGHHWLVDEHRNSAGTAILPGTGHIELLLAAARAGGLDLHRLDQVALYEPLVVADAHPVTVRVVIEPSDGDTRSVRLDSDGGTGTAWTTHSEATLAGGDEQPLRLDVAAIEARCQLDADDPMAPARAHLQLGPRWSTASRTGLGEGESFGRLELPHGEAARWVAHPALVDVATGFGVLLAPDVEAGQLHVPVGYAHVESSGPIPSPCVVHATRPPSSHDELVVVDLAVADESGVIALRIDGLQLRPLDHPATLGDVEPAPPPDHPAHGLLELADRYGLRPDEGTGSLERLVGSEAHRLVVSSVDLDALAAARFDEPDVPTETPRSDATSIDEMITTMWSELLGVDEVGPDDDFFDLGGHSLIAIRLMTRIKRELEVRFQLSTIFEASTVASLAALVRAQRPELESELADGAPASDAATTDVSGSDSHLVTISKAGDGAPLYVVHGAGGNVLFLWSLTRAMGGERPVFGFQAHGINDDEVPDASIEQMAERYVTELRAHSPGPYLLAGYSGGGIVTLEMVRQLQQAGESVQHVLLFDSVPTGRAWPGRSIRWRNLARHAVRRGPRSIAPYIKRQIIGSLRRFVPERAERRHEHDSQDRALGYRDVGEHGFVNLYYYFSATADRYTTATYDVDVTVLKADRVWPTQPDDYHWGAHIRGRLGWRTVPGDHHSMFYPEHAPALAAVVREVLDEVSAPPPSDDSSG